MDFMDNYVGLRWNEVELTLNAKYKDKGAEITLKMKKRAM